MTTLVASVEETGFPNASCAAIYRATSASKSTRDIPSPLTVSAMGSGVAVGGSGVNVAWGVGVGSGARNEAQAESPSAARRVKTIQMEILYRENIARIIR